MVRIVSLLIALLLSLLPLPVLAQAVPAPPAGAAEETHADPFGRQTPRGTVRGYLAAVAADDLTRAARYLEVADPDALPSRRAARSLRIVLDRAGDLLPVTEIANTAEGSTGDALEGQLDRVGSLGEGRARIDLHVRRVERDGQKVWLFEAGALKALPMLLQHSKVGLVEQWTPLALKGVEFMGVTAGDWAALGVVAAGAMLAGLLAAFGVGGIVRAVWRRTGEARDGRWLTRARMPFALMLAVMWFKTGALALGISIVGRTVGGTVADIVFVFAAGWFAAVAVDHLSRTFLSRMTGRTQATATSVVALVKRLAKTLILLAATFVTLDICGVDVTTGLAALGIGGLALALGAQKTVENLVGSVTVVADQPIRIGDFCRFDGIVGTVEDIGIRSTRVRTLERTLVTIPNGAFASMQIENYSKRERFLFRHELSLRYETPVATVRAMVERLRRMLAERPDVPAAYRPRVNFKALGADNLTVEIFAYFQSTDYVTFLDVQQEMLLEIMSVFEEMGVEFAFPSQTLYLARDASVPWEAGISPANDRTLDARANERAKVDFGGSLAPTSDDLRDVVKRSKERAA